MTAKEFFDSPLFFLIVLTVLVSIIWILMKTGVVETSKQHKKRKQDEADVLAEMTPEVRHLHLEAERKLADFKFSFIIWVLAIIFSGSIVYWAFK